MNLATLAETIQSHATAVQRTVRGSAENAVAQQRLQQAGQLALQRLSTARAGEDPAVFQQVRQAAQEAAQGRVPQVLPAITGRPAATPAPSGKTPPAAERRTRRSDRPRREGAGAAAPIPLPADDLLDTAGQALTSVGRRAGQLLEVAPPSLYSYIGTSPLVTALAIGGTALLGYLLYKEFTRKKPAASTTAPKRPAAPAGA